MNTANRYVATRRTARQRISLGWLLSSLGIVLTLLAGCVPIQPAATMPSQQPTTFEGLSSGLDNVTQARIRVTSAVLGAPNTDVYINGLPVVNGGKGSQNLEMGVFSSWLYVTPGTYTVALVTHGKTLDQALFAPVEVNAVAGHRYTVAAMGQLEANNVKPLIIDETALETAIGAKATDNIGLSINNLTGANGVDRLIDGKVGATMQYGEAQPSICRNPNSIHEAYTVAGKPETVFASGDFWCDPAAGYAMAWNGDYPDHVNGTPDSGRTSELNTLDFLAAVNAQPGVMDGHLLSFNTLLAAIDKAGMRDQFANSDPYFFLAPTDEAFATLPKDQLDALLNDPEALTTLLKAHFVPGYYPYGYFSGVFYAHADGPIPVTNLLGQKLEILNSTVNGREMTGKSYTVDHGNRVQLTYKLLPVK